MYVNSTFSLPKVNNRKKYNSGVNFNIWFLMQNNKRKIIEPSNLYNSLLRMQN